MSNNRKSIHAYVSNDAHNGWQEFSEEHGISISAMIEALGPNLNETEHADLITQARKIGADRRRRKK